MTHPTLMVHLTLGQANTGLLQVAGDLADRLEADVIGVAACQPMQMVYGEAYVTGEVVEQIRQELESEIEAAAAAFHAAFGSRSGLVQWRSTVTLAPLSEYLTQQARSADIFLTGMDRNTSMFDTTRHVNSSDLVMQMGRPVITVPSRVERLALEHVVVFWKESCECRRAVLDALPLLQKAARVSVITIAMDEDLAEARTNLADMAAWLQRHGVAAACAAAPAAGDDAAQLRDIAAAEAADLVVAGAYGHSRLREWALGGVTRDLLLRAGHCSLVSH